MQYVIQLRYFYGWDDANWTEETDGETKALRFETVQAAQGALGEFFHDVKSAVTSGDMDVEEARGDYRITAVKD